MGDVAHWLCVSRLRGVPQGEASSIVHMTASPCLSGDCEACAGNKARLPRLSEFRAKATSGNTARPGDARRGGTRAFPALPYARLFCVNPAAPRPAPRCASFDARIVCLKRGSTGQSTSDEHRTLSRSRRLSKPA